MIKSVFQKQGISVDAGGNAPVLLNDENRVWLVASGSVDIFAVRTDDGRSVGARTYVLHADEGRILFGIEPAKYGTDIGLLAAGRTGTKLCSLPFSSFMGLAGEGLADREIALLIDLWIEELSNGVRTNPMPKVFTALEPESRISTGTSECVRPSKGVLWARNPKEGFLFMGKNEWPPVTRGRFFPVSEKSWLTAEVQSEIEVTDTQNHMFQQDFRNDLKNFHCLILDVLSVNIKEKRESERQRLRRKSDKGKAVFESALSNIAGILKPDSSVPENEEEGDLLLSACQKIGRMSGIEFRAPLGKVSSADRLDAVTRTSRIRKRKVLLRGDWWNRDNGPMLTLTKTDRTPVALLPVSPKQYKLYDPAEKVLKPINREVADSLAPFAYTFYRPLPERALKGLDLLQHGLFGCGKDLFMVLLMGIAGALLGLLTPVATGIIFDAVIPEAAHNHLIQVGLILVSTAVAISVFEITRGIALLRTESRMDAAIQTGIMDRLLSLPVPFFRGFTAGDLAQRVMGINRISQILSGVTVQAILAGSFSSINFVLMFWYDWKLALITAGVLFASILLIGIANYIQVRYQRDLFAIQGRISGMVLQFITGISKLRVSGTEDRAFAVWAESFRKQKQIAFKSRSVANIVATYNAALPILAMMAIFAWITAQTTASLSTGEFLAFNSAFNSFQAALLRMVAAFTSVLNIVPLYERAKPVIETVPEVGMAKTDPGELVGDIDVSHIWFRYDSTGPAILKDVSLEIAPGEFVALVGGSGSGKSTLLRVLLGFEPPESGTIYYDGHDLATLDIGAVRRQIGVVLQNGKIMSGTVYENIIGASNLTMDDAWEAARMSGFEEDVKEMPMGMHTVLSAGGGTLSGGQKQRLLIARAIVHKPRILFFDEATSALDNKTQSTVSKSLEKLQATRVVIAHRLSTIINADHIFVFEKGQLAQSGTYDELMQQKGLFAELVKRQTV